MALKETDPKKGMHLKSYVYQQPNLCKEMESERRQVASSWIAVRWIEWSWSLRRSTGVNLAPLNWRTTPASPVKRIASIRANKPQVVESWIRSLVTR